MKLICVKHGCHFPEDFVATCPLWKEWKLQKLKREDKKKVWDWLFALNRDEIAIKYKIALETHIRGVALPGKKFSNGFAATVPNYEKMTDKERKAFQRAYFKNKLAPKTVQLSWYRYYWERLKGNL